MNESKVEAFLNHANQLAQWVKDLNPHEIVFLHHNDADGISAGAILSKAIYRLAIKSRRISLEKPYPQAIERIVESIEYRSKSLLLFADFASGMLEILDREVPQDLPILVLDHHQMSAGSYARIQCLNPLMFGISGGSDCSASVVCYLFARALQVWNRDLASLALIGVFGDGQFGERFSLSGLNQIALADALDQAQMVSDPLPSIVTKETYPIADIVKYVNALGSIGYFEGGVDIALKGLADGWGIEAKIRGEEYALRFELLVKEFCQQVELSQEGVLTWFVVPTTFPRVGVKTVGLLCEELIKKGLISDGHYVLGIQPIPSLSLGFGELNFDEEKVSMRTTRALKRRIEDKLAPSLVDVLPLATRVVGGFVDACHPHAAATTIPKVKRGEFIKEVLRLVAED